MTDDNNIGLIKMNQDLDEESINVSSDDTRLSSSSSSLSTLSSSSSSASNLTNSEVWD